MSEISLYLDSNAIIDLIKQKVGANLSPEREQDAWYVDRLLEASRLRRLRIFTSALSIIECVHVGDQSKDQASRPFFDGLLQSGKSGIVLIQPTTSIIDKARSLRWVYGSTLKGIDAIHAASAMHFRCTEFLSRDENFLRNSKILQEMQLRTCAPSETVLLPAEFRQQTIDYGKSGSSRP